MHHLLAQRQLTGAKSLATFSYRLRKSDTPKALQPRACFGQPLSHTRHMAILLAQVISADLAASSPVSPAVDGRVVDCSKAQGNALCAAAGTAVNATSTTGSRSANSAGAAAGRPSGAVASLVSVMAAMCWAAAMML